MGSAVPKTTSENHNKPSLTPNASGRSSISIDDIRKGIAVGFNLIPPVLFILWQWSSDSVTKLLGVDGYTLAIFWLLAVIYYHVQKLGKADLHPKVQVLSNDGDFRQRVFNEYVKGRKINKIMAIRYTGSRFGGDLRHLLDNQKDLDNITIFLQHPDKLIDDYARDDFRSFINGYRDELHRVHIKLYKDPPSLGALCFNDDMIILWWYMIHHSSDPMTRDRRFTVRGNETVRIKFKAPSDEYASARDLVERTWKVLEANSIPLEDYLKRNPKFLAALRIP